MNRLLLSLTLLPAFALAAVGPLSLGNYTLVKSTVINRTQIEYEYRVTIANAGTDAATNVSAVVSSNSPNTVVVPAFNQVTWGTVPGATGFPTPLPGTKVSTNTFKLQQNRAVAFSPTVLAWTFPSGLQTAPTANAGPNQSIVLSTTAQLNGSASFDPGRNPLTYLWSFQSKPTGSNTTIVNPTAVMTSFVPDVAGSYVLQLVVNNGFQSSLPAVVTISTGLVAPIANAGPDRYLKPDTYPQQVSLDGSKSISPGGLPLTYSWRIENPASGASLSSTTSVTPVLTLTKADRVRVSLIVHNGFSGSNPDEVEISLDVNMYPNAGPDQFATVGQVVHVSGVHSTNRHGLRQTYEWSFVSKPPGSTASLLPGERVNNSFTVDQAGIYVVQMRVSTGFIETSDTLVVSTSPLPPVANAGPSQKVFRGAPVTLTGAASRDLGGLPLSYTWSLLSRPGGSNASLTSTTAISPSFVADRDGNYVAQLTVSNGTLTSTASNVLISTDYVAPSGNAGPDQTVAIGASVVLDATLSNNPSGYPLTYFWAQLSGPPVSLSSPTVAQPGFLAATAGTYVFQLIADDGSIPTASPAPDTVMITVTGATAPLIMTLAGTGSALFNGETGLGTLTLAEPAPTGGATINLSASSNLVTGLPASVTIPAGQTSATFSMTANGKGTVTLTASATGFSTATTTQVVTTDRVLLPLNFTLGPGQSTTYAIALNNPAPHGRRHRHLGEFEPVDRVALGHHHHHSRRRHPTGHSAHHDGARTGIGDHHGLGFESQNRRSAGLRSGRRQLLAHQHHHSQGHYAEHHTQPDACRAHGRHHAQPHFR